MSVCGCEGEIERVCVCMPGCVSYEVVCERV